MLSCTLLLYTLDLALNQILIIFIGALVGIGYNRFSPLLQGEKTVDQAFISQVSLTQKMNAFFWTAFELPTFVWALAGGILLRNVVESIFKREIFDRSIDVFGNTALALYLAMALVSLKLWQLSDLAIPMIILLIAQSIAMWLFAVYVSFRVMGKNYDSAVLASGLCGFGMGATPNAIANMQAITNMYGPSHKAFLIVPLVGAFFIDLVNVVVIQGILQFFG